MATSVEAGTSSAAAAANDILLGAENGGPPSSINPTTSSASTSSSGNHVLLKDVGHLVRLGIVAVPSGFTKLGHPVLYLPDNDQNQQHVNEVLDPFSSILESDLHLLFKYYLAVVPRSEQSSGFALIIDRRHSDFSNVRITFQKVVTLFPARIREVYLLHGPRGLAKDLLSNQLVEEFLLDFDIFNVSEPADLIHYLDSKYIPSELGGHLINDVEGWLVLQEHVETFSFSARRIARRLAQFVGILNQEDLGHFRNSPGDVRLREVATKNRAHYRRLRKELEDLTDHGLRMLKSLQRPEANIMQRLAVQLLCKQLDQAWTYFNRSWKMQDHVYVQYLELNSFQTRFRELSVSLEQVEINLREFSTSATTVDNANLLLDTLESMEQNLVVESTKARDLIRLGQDLLDDHRFAADCVQPKCAELRRMIQKLEMTLSDKKRLLHKFLDLNEGIEAAKKWSNSSLEHLERQDNPRSSLSDEDVFSQIRQIDYLLSKSRELKLRNRRDFEDTFEELKDMLTAQTIFAVDDALDQLEEVTVQVMQRRDELRARATRTDRKYGVNNGGSIGSSSSGLGSSGGLLSGDSEGASDSARIKRENILSELLVTESKYASDLQQVLRNYRDKLSVSNLTETRQKSSILFGNLDEIHAFHATVFYPELERCGANPASVGRNFLAHCSDFRALYSSYCQNMPSARQAITDLGGEANPASILHHCQTEAGHQLPLSSYLLKPMQRLTKYQLLLKDLVEASNIVCGKPELEEALNELLSVVKTVNDSLHSVTIKGLPSAANPLGPLIAQNVFQVITDTGKSQSQILFRNKGQRRHVFLYENHLVFTKVVNEKSALFQFKMAMATSSLGMSSVVRGDDKKLELWVHGRNELYSLEAIKGRQAKEEFAAELRKVIIRQKDQMQKVRNVVYVETASNSTMNDHTENSTKPEGSGRPSSRLTRSRSLESRRIGAALRSRSLDCAGDRSSPEADQEEEAISGQKFMVLADYMALTSREIDLAEDEVVELVKVGCAGWWYVRITTYPYLEGWAPSTYLEKLT